MNALAKSLLIMTTSAALVLAQPVSDFTAATTHPTGGSTSMAVVADFNGDGAPDIITVEQASQSLSILFGIPGGGFQPLVTRGFGFGVSSIASADFNGDGLPDLVMTTGFSAVVMLNTGAGTFAPPLFFGTNITPIYVAAADLNHDGKIDLALAGSGGFAILRGLGTGAFTAPQVLPQIVTPTYLILADFNNDGNVDLLGDNGASGSFYAGLGDGTFAAPIATTQILYGAVVADFNPDGKLDVATTLTQQRQNGVVQEVQIAYGLGDGRFQAGFGLVLSGSAISQPVAADFNGDGRPDIAIRRGSTSDIQVYLGDGSAVSTNSFTSGTLPAGTLMAADTDGNGSKDLVLVSSNSMTIFRDTHGNPPLVAQVSISPASVVGGAMTQGTVTLGGPAPAAGAIVTVTSSNASASILTVNSVTIPTGASSTTFSISTSSVATATPVTISAAWNGVTTTSTLNVVAPYSLSALSINPASQFGIFTAQGVVTLSSPADSNAVVTLVSANPSIASVPATVTVPAGETTATFPVVLQPVVVDTPVAIAASMGGVAQSASITVLKPLDSVQITRAEDAVRQGQLKLDATSTSASATVAVWNASTGALIGTMSNAGNGKYTGTFAVPGAVLSVTLKSSLGGTTTGPVVQK